MSRYNYFNNLTVDGYAFPTTPQVNFNFNSNGFTFLTKGTVASNTIEYSFDGYNTHGDLVPGSAAAGVTFDMRHESKVWFRRIGGPSVTVRIEAWGDWGRTS